MKFWCLQISQKAKQIIDRFLPYEARAEICQKFGWLFDRFHSEINWPLKLANPVDYDVNTIPICLPPDDKKLVGEKAWVKGWGRLYEGKYNGNTFGYAWLLF